VKGPETPGQPGTPEGESPRDPELERLLARAPTPAPRASFAAVLRNAFLTGAEPKVDESGSRPASELRKEAAVTDRIEERIARIEAPAARSEFREGLRRRFVEGGAPAALRPVRSASAGPRRSGVTRATRRAAGRGGRPFPMRVVGATLAAAAAVALVFLWPRAVPGDAPGGEDVAVVTEPAWRVLGHLGTASVGGSGFAPDASVALAAAIASGTPIETADAPLELAWGERFAIELQPRTRLVPTALDPAESVLRLERGEVYLATLAEHDGRILVDTPASQVVVTGTTLGVFADPAAGSCVCVVEGEVEVNALGETRRVGSRCTLRLVPGEEPDAHGFPESGEAGHEHVGPLERFHERH